MYRQQFWSLRQNPYANTNQRQMRELIISQDIVTCPFGHLNNERNNVIMVCIMRNNRTHKTANLLKI